MIAPCFTIILTAKPPFTRNMKANVIGSFKTILPRVYATVRVMWYQDPEVFL